jgi:hypothetical protein
MGATPMKVVTNALSLTLLLPCKFNGIRKRYQLNAKKLEIRITSRLKSWLYNKKSCLRN